jgi:hypothetical protein
MYEHPVSSEQHSAQHRLVLDLRLRIPMQVSCHFGCFACAALHFFSKKKSRKKSQKKATPSTTSAHDLFSMLVMELFVFFNGHFHL